MLATKQLNGASIRTASGIFWALLLFCPCKLFSILLNVPQKALKWLWCCVLFHTLTNIIIVLLPVFVNLLIMIYWRYLFASSCRDAFITLCGSAVSF